MIYLWAEYAPYHLMPEFEYGYDDYGSGSPPLESLGGIRQQAYDRGLECAMRAIRVDAKANTRASFIAARRKIMGI